MNKKLFNQITNEWRSNVWLGIELVLVSVVMWYVVDYYYVTASVYNEPRGFDIENCYLITMGELTEKSPDYIANQTPEEYRDDALQMLQRLKNRPDVEAASISNVASPYNGSNTSTSLQHDTLLAGNWLIRRTVMPDFLRVFRYHGMNGETPEQLAELLKDEHNILASDNLYEQKYGVKLTSLVNKNFYMSGDTTESFKLAASLQPVRYQDFQQAMMSYCVVNRFPEQWLLSAATEYEWCVRVKEGQDKGFKERLLADSEKHFRVGNFFIAEVRSFADIRRNFQMAQTTRIRTYAFGMGFLLLNIFLGLLGTFWFRTQQRRGEIALMKVMGGTDRSVFIRLISEGLLLLLLATIPALVIDFNLAYAEMNAWMNGTTLEVPRLLITGFITFVLIAAMIIIGIWIPASRAMKVQPAEALHAE